MRGAPLHDGALILRGDRLYAAGCVLPLTQNKELNKELGTRHRAGIGITENSDAFGYNRIRGDWGDFYCSEWPADEIY